MYNPINLIKPSYIGKTVDKISDCLTKTALNQVKERTISNEKVLKTFDYIGEKISSPENRIILGVTAILSQPFIDMANHRVDNETRKVSVARTCAKIIAGTLTGFFVRKWTIAGIRKMCQESPKLLENGKLSRTFKSLLKPDNATNPKKLGDYVKAMGSYASLGIMLFTNFLIDAPLTKYLTNLFVGKSDKLNQKTTDFKDKGGNK